MEKNTIENKLSSKIKSKFNLVGILNTVIQKQFYWLGTCIGKDPKSFIIIPTLLAIICISGFQQMQIESDPEFLFTPTNGIGKENKDSVENLFMSNLTNGADWTKITYVISIVNIKVMAKDNGSMLREKQWEELNYVEELIKNVTIDFEGKTITYGQICIKHKENCLENTAFRLNDIMPYVFNGSIMIRYPFMLQPYVLPQIWGGVKVDEDAGELLEAKAVGLMYFSDHKNLRQKERNEKWEDRAIRNLLSTEFEYIEVFVFGVLSSMNHEFQRQAEVVAPYLLINAMLMIIFSLTAVSAIDCIRSKFYLGIVGIIITLLATAAGFGLLMYLQVPFVSTAMCIPILLLGIGLDDQFVLLSAWHRTDERKDVPERLADAYHEAASAITITSLTTSVSSLAGMLTPFPGISYYCLTIAVCIFLQYLLFVTIFGGCLAISGYAEKQKRHAITCRPMKDSELDTSSVFKGGKLSKETSEQSTTEQLIPRLFRDYLAEFLNKKVGKGIVIVSYLFYLAGAIYGISTLDEGMGKTDMVLEDSYVAKFLLVEDKYFHRIPYQIHIVIDEELDYSNQEVRRNLMKMHNDFENVPNIVDNEIFTVSWIRHFYRWLDRHPEISNNITDSKSFVKMIKKDFLSKRKHLIGDVVFNNDESAIIASRFAIQAEWLKTIETEKHMIVNLRKLSSEQLYNVFPFAYNFIFLDQLFYIRQITAQTVGTAAAAIMFMAYLFLPSMTTAVVNALSIISINIGVIGYMSIWGINLNSISCMFIIMCIGFSIDFIAHISFAFTTTKVNSAKDRVRYSLYSLGLPIIQGALSTILSVILLGTVPSYLYRTLFKIILMVMVFGLLHALLLLPIVLSFFAKDFTTASATNEDNELDTVVAKKEDIETASDSDHGIETMPSSKQESICDENSIHSKNGSLDRIDESTQGIVNEGFETTEYEDVRL